MCLIIVKPEGKAMPPDNYILNAYNNNPDGFGIAWREQGMSKVAIQKGIMSIAGVYDLLDSIKNPVSKTIVMHFRLATEGKVSPENCHPFPISNKVSELQALEIESKYAIAHNGIILAFNSKRWGTQAYGGNWNKDLSDTQEFIIDYLAGMGKALFNPKVMELIHDYTESKFVILSQSHTQFIGDFEEEDGLYYSNTSYKWQYGYYKIQTAADNKEGKTGVVYDKKGGVIAKYDANKVPKPAGKRARALGWQWCEICNEDDERVQYCPQEDMWLCPDCSNQFIYSGLPYGSKDRIATREELGQDFSS